MQFLGSLLRGKPGMVLIYVLIAGCVATATAVVLSNQGSDKKQPPVEAKTNSAPVNVAPGTTSSTTVVVETETVTAPENGVVVAAPEKTAETTTESPKTAPVVSRHRTAKRRIAVKQQAFPAIPVFEGDRVELMRPGGKPGTHEVEEWFGTKKRIFSVPQS